MRERAKTRGKRETERVGEKGDLASSITCVLTNFTLPRTENRSCLFPGMSWIAAISMGHVSKIDAKASAMSSKGAVS